MSCKFSAALPLHVLWLVPTNDTLLESSEGPYTLETFVDVPNDTLITYPEVTTELTVDEVQAEMDGLFVCTAVNDAGVTIGKVKLNGKSRDFNKFRQKRERFVVETSNFVVLTCSLLIITVTGFKLESGPERRQEDSRTTTEFFVFQQSFY